MYKHTSSAMNTLNKSSTLHLNDSDNLTFFVKIFNPTAGIDITIIFTTCNELLTIRRVSTGNSSQFNIFFNNFGHF